MGMDDPHPLPPRLAAILRDMPLDDLAFAPVPVRARQDGWSHARQRAFIDRLALAGSVSTAARAVGMTRASAYRLRERAGAESFAAAWDVALAMGQDRRIDHAIERAVAGEVRPVFYRGRKCGEHLHFSNGLTIAVLNAIGLNRSGPARRRGRWAGGD
jgi:hypothetical protein